MGSLKRIERSRRRTGADGWFRSSYLRHMSAAGQAVLPPTTADLLDDASRPYFIWWAEVTVGELRRRIGDRKDPTSDYWLGAVLREANSRDVWLFTTPDQVRARWSDIARFLGRTRKRWAWLLDIPDTGSHDEHQAHA